MKTIKVGDFEVTSLFENKFMIDGGSMFGVIPKKIWSKFVEANEENFITLDIHPLLVKTGKNNVLIDTGIGDALDDKLRKIYGITEKSKLVDSLAEVALKPEDIDTVIFSHLHADHALGGLKLDDEGNVCKVFPNAKYYAQKTEIEDAMSPNERTAATYISDLLRYYGEIQAVDGDGQIVDGIAVIQTGGHTRGHQAVYIQSGDDSLIYTGDIIPTTIHLRPVFIAGVDTFPLDTLQQKKGIIRECAENKRFIAFDHDSDIGVGRLIKKSEDEIVLEPAE
ncbi:MAG: MBL fold metallo-hydrolase [candidate division Zixibacteria bacterium]|nr:MBL fold metallo-hydrolase [candidate division Zixibacteria bacterium]